MGDDDGARSSGNVGSVPFVPAHAYDYFLFED